MCVCLDYFWIRDGELEGCAECIVRDGSVLTQALSLFVSVQYPAARDTRRPVSSCAVTLLAEVRNLMQYSTGFGVLSTNSRTLEG